MDNRKQSLNLIKDIKKEVDFIYSELSELADGYQDNIALIHKLISNLKSLI